MICYPLILKILLKSESFAKLDVGLITDELLQVTHIKGTERIL